MIKKVFFCVLLVLTFVLSSCGIFFDDTAGPVGNLTLSFGEPAVRAVVSGVPTAFPAFSSITVNIKENQKIIAGKTFPGSQKTVTLSVPPGRGYTVEVYALVDHANSDKSFGFCHSFSGLTEGVEILEGKNTAVPVSLAMKESVLVHNINITESEKLSFWSAPGDENSLSASEPLAEGSLFAFDKYGRFYFVKAGSGQDIYQELVLPLDDPEKVNSNSASDVLNGLAYDSLYNLLLFRTDDSGVDGDTVDYLCLDDNLPVAIATMTNDAVGNIIRDDYPGKGPLAADGTGHFFLVQNDTTNDPDVLPWKAKILKLRLENDGMQFSYTNQTSTEASVAIVGLTVCEGKLLALGTTDGNDKQLLGFDTATMEPLWPSLDLNSADSGLEKFYYPHFAGNRENKVYITAHDGKENNKPYFVEIDIDTGSLGRIIPLSP